MQRCYNEKHEAYLRYGGRGIKVAERWHNVAAFIEDIESILGPRPEGKSLDRYPVNDGPYAPGNVRWATRSEQARNRRRTSGLTIDREQVNARRRASYIKQKAKASLNEGRLWPGGVVTAGSPLDPPVTGGLSIAVTPWRERRADLQLTLWVRWR